MLIRKAVLTDAEGIARVQVAGWHATYPGLVPDAELAAMTVPDRLPKWRGFLSAGGPGGYWVAVVDDAVTGFACAGPVRDDVLRGLGASGEIWGVYVAPDAQGRGIGGALIRHALAWLRAGGHQAVGLWAVEGNDNAAGVYRHLGAVDGPVQRVPVTGGEMDERAFIWPAE